jgi:hypothetical protein
LVTGLSDAADDIRTFCFRPKSMENLHEMQSTIFAARGRTANVLRALEYMAAHSLAGRNTLR